MSNSTRAYSQTFTSFRSKSDYKTKLKNITNPQKFNTSHMNNTHNSFNTLNTPNTHNTHNITSNRNSQPGFSSTINNSNNDFSNFSNPISPRLAIKINKSKQGIENILTKYTDLKSTNRTLNNLSQVYQFIILVKTIPT